MAEIEQFYRVFHSMRYVGKYLILRLNQQISPEYLLRINAKYGVLCKQGLFETCEATPQEIQGNDSLDKYRIKFEFVRHDLGGLRDLIDYINRAD